MPPTQRIKTPSFLLLALLALSSCAGLPETSDEVITLQTAPQIASTTCTVSDSLGAWSVWTVPGYVDILRDSKPLYVTCQSPQGYHGTAAIKANLQPTATFFGAGSDKIAENSDAPPPAAPYQSNTTNAWNGTFTSYPGTIIVHMIPDTTAGFTP